MASPAVYQLTPKYRIKQGGSAPPLTILDAEPEPPVKPDFDTIAYLLDMLSMLPCVKELVADLEARHRHVGRKGYRALSMLKAFVCKYLKGERSTARFIRDLKQNPALRRVCGFGNRVPDPATFSRFYAKLTEDPERLELIQQAVVAELRKYLPDLAEHVSVDGTDIESPVNHRKKPWSDPDLTKMGYRTPKNGAVAVDGMIIAQDGKKKTQFFVGYKAHVMADPIYGTPIAQTVRPANDPERAEFLKLLDKARSMHDWFAPNCLSADAGYSGEKIASACVERGIIPIIAEKSAPTTGPTTAPGRYRGGLYNSDGAPTCPDSKHTPMEWIRTVHEDCEIYHEYRCPPQGCELRARSSGAMVYCSPQDVHRERAGNEEATFDLAPPIARADPRFKELMKKRAGIERFFSVAKSARSLDSLTYRRWVKVKVHVNLSITAYLITQLAHAKAGDIDAIRRMTIEELE